MLRKMKIISVVGARPNFMKIAPFIKAIDEHNKTKNNKTKTWGGKKRTEVIEYTVSSGHLDNNLHSKFRIKKGAKYDKSESKLEYFHNLIANASLEIEEYISTILKGEPKRNRKHQKFVFTYNDQDDPTNANSSDPIKCAKKG